MKQSGIFEPYNSWTIYFPNFKCVCGYSSLTMWRFTFPMETKAPIQLFSVDNWLHNGLGLICSFEHQNLLLATLEQKNDCCHGENI